MAELFEKPADGEKALATGEISQVVGVAVATNVWRTFDYAWPGKFGSPSIGQRVRVPFGKGNRLTLGFIAELDRLAGERALKAVAEVIDQTSRLDDSLWKLGQWISQYYLSPLGMVLAAMIPSAVGRHGERNETVAFLVKERKDWPDGLGPRQKRALDELYEARLQGIEPLTMESLLGHSKAGRESIRRLADRGLIHLEIRPVRIPSLDQVGQADPFDLNDQQQAVMDALAPKLAGGFSVTLLHGVTGSGKTEVYIRAIRRVVAAGKQAILLAPEIALATQTYTRLIQRLPRVAVLHSGLSGSERAFYYEQIAQGLSGVVVGPRSAIFAPARRLGLIIVDEEHEPSYKQDTVPRYHGRDVAVMRGSFSGVPVILGSATPSLESLRNVQLKRYDLLRLPSRVRGLPMPKLQIVHLRRELTPGRVELIGRTLTQKIAAALERSEQVILLMNRRGYASFVFCPSCQWSLACEQCTRAMVFHQATQLAMCHYCQRTAPLPEVCPACKGKLLLFGLGIQRIENEIARKFPNARLARMDSDTMTSAGQFRRVFDEFTAGSLDVLLGTQMVAKGLDFPRVSLVGVVSADTSLSIPDFRAAERTFQLVVQVAGRAGRAELPGEVVVQTLHEQEPAIVFASRHDYNGFAAWEMPQRQATGMPPFSRMVRFVVRHADPLKAQDSAEKLAGQLRQLLAGAGVTIIGPGPAIIRKIKNLFRFQLLLLCPRAGEIQQILAPQMEGICRALPAEVIADVDPIHLL